LRRIRPEKPFRLPAEPFPSLKRLRTYGPEQSLVDAGPKSSCRKSGQIGTGKRRCLHFTPGLGDEPEGRNWNRRAVANIAAVCGVPCGPDSSSRWGNDVPSHFGKARYFCVMATARFFLQRIIDQGQTSRLGSVCPMASGLYWELRVL
jgi:hypothetical protein